MPESLAPIVIKLGGSVLTGPRAYGDAATWLSTRVFGAPVLVVVSAENGVTDRLLAEATSIAKRPDTRALDLLWSTGELRSAALLALHLQAIGIPSCALNVHESGLRRRASRVCADTRALRRALETHAIVIVPGFLASNARGSIVTLGRGGSDRSAIELAAALGARTCELIKDVPGYFTADPARESTARHLPDITYDDALAMARGGCDLVQPAAIESARRHGIDVVIRSLARDARQTVLSTAKERLSASGESHAIRHQDDSRRAAVGA